jgi:hypothetical protein
MFFLVQKVHVLIMIAIRQYVIGLSTEMWYAE